jgi:hypothetical protein
MIIIFILAVLGWGIFAINNENNRVMQDDYERD